MEVSWHDRAAAAMSGSLLFDPKRLGWYNKPNHFVDANQSLASTKKRKAAGRLPPFRGRVRTSCGTRPPERSIAARAYARWVVERTFAWLNRNRRLAKEFEQTIRSATAFLYAASAMMLIRRLARYA
jgi:hypothetical protein